MSYVLDLNNKHLVRRNFQITLECYKNHILSNLSPGINIKITEFLEKLINKEIIQEIKQINYVEFYKLTKTLGKLALLCDDKNDGSCEGENSTDDKYSDVNDTFMLNALVELVAKMWVWYTKIIKCIQYRLKLLLESLYNLLLIINKFYRIAKWKKHDHDKIIATINDISEGGITHEAADSTVEFLDKVSGVTFKW
jgi:hypothetical protein